MAQKIVYSFPVLKEEEIYKTLQQLDIKIDQADLKTPTTEKVRNIFSSFYEYLNLDDPHKIIMEKQDTLNQIFRCSTQETHYQSLPTITFFIQMKQILSICGMKDFTITDITLPSRQRLRVQLSALFNYVKFKESLQTSLMDLIAQNKPDQDHQKFLNQLFEQKQQELQLLRQQYEDVTPAINQINKQIKQHLISLQTNVNDHSRAQQQITELERQRNQLEIQKKSLLQINDQQFSTNTDLQQHAFSSENYQQLAQELIRLDRESDNQEQIQQQRSGELFALEADLQNAQKKINELNQITEEQFQVEEMQQKCKQSENFAQEFQQSIQQAAQEKDFAKQQIAKVQQQIGLLKKQQSAEDFQLKQNFFDKQEQKRKLELELDAQMTRLVHLKEQLEEINSKVNEMRMMHQIRCTKLIQQINEILKCWTVQAEEMQKCM